MGDSYVTATHPALNSVCCYTLGGKPPCLKKKNRPGPSLCPPWAGNIAGVIGDALVMGGAAPILLRFVVPCRPWAGPGVVLACWCGLNRRSRPPWERALRGAGVRHVRIQLRPPSGVTVPSGWRRASPRPGGGGGPALPRPAGSRGGKGEGGGEGGPCRFSPAPCPVGWPMAPVPVTLRLRCAPLGYTRAVGVAGRPWAPVGQCSGGGGEVSSPRSAPQPSSGWHQSRPLSVRIPGCRRPVAGRQRVMWERSTGGAWRAAALAAAVVSAPPGVAAPLGGCGAAVSQAGPCPPIGWGGGGGRGRGGPRAP